jgi:hypothetical protein
MHRDVGCGHPLADQFVPRLGAETAADLGERRGGRLAERLLDGLLAGGADRGEAHAVGGQERRQRMNQHPGHTERVGDQAGVLAAGAAEAVQRVTGDVVAALYRDFLDRIGHVLDRDANEAVGDVFRRPVADLARELFEPRPHGLRVEGLVLAGAEDLREEVRHQLAEHHIGVGDRERAAAPIAGRSRIGAGGIRADPETHAVIMQDRAAAGRDGMDQHHGRAHAHARHFGLEGALVIAVEMGDVGRGAAHVEADQAIEPGLAPSLCHADDAARRTGQDRVLAVKEVGGGEPARRHHEHEWDGGILAACLCLLPPPLRGRVGEGGRPRMLRL